MKSHLAILTVSLALLGVLTGSLLRPCDCGSGGGPTSDATSAAKGSPCATCRCGTNETLARNPGEDGDVPGDEPGDDGCEFCCKPAPPAVEASSAVTFAPPSLVAVPTSRRPALDLDGEAPALVRGGAAPPDGAPWRLSEEGLAVFRL